MMVLVVEGTASQQALGRTTGHGVVERTRAGSRVSACPALRDLSMDLHIPSRCADDHPKSSSLA